MTVMSKARSAGRKVKKTVKRLARKVLPGKSKSVYPMVSLAATAAQIPFAIPSVDKSISERHHLDDKTGIPIVHPVKRVLRGVRGGGRTLHQGVLAVRDGIFLDANPRTEYKKYAIDKKFSEAFDLDNPNSGIPVVHPVKRAGRVLRGGGRTLHQAVSGVVDIVSLRPNPRKETGFGRFHETSKAKHTFRGLMEEVSEKMDRKAEERARLDARRFKTGRVETSKCSFRKGKKKCSCKSKK
jgi:hypothetical protein